MIVSRDRVAVLLYLLRCEGVRLELLERVIEGSRVDGEIPETFGFEREAYGLWAERAARRFLDRRAVADTATATPAKGV